MKRQEEKNQEPTIQPVIAELILDGQANTFSVPALVANSLEVDEGAIFTEDDLEKMRQLALNSMKYLDLIMRPMGSLGAIPKLQN